MAEMWTQLRTEKLIKEFMMTIIKGHLVLMVFASGLYLPVLLGQDASDLEIITDTNAFLQERSAIQLEGTKRTDYLEQTSRRGRKNRYLSTIRVAEPETLDNALDLTERPATTSSSSSEKALSYNEVEFALGTHNHLNAHAYITRAFNDHLLTLNIEAAYASALSILTTNQYTGLANSELTRFLIEQDIALNHNQHIISVRHLTQIEGLQAFTLPEAVPVNTPDPPSAATAPTRFNHSLFLNSIAYQLTLPFPSEQVEDLTLNGDFNIHYGQHFLRVNRHEKRLERHQFQESQQLTVRFTKHLQHHFNFVFSLAFAAFTSTHTYDIATTLFFDYRYEGERFSVQLGLGDHYRVESLLGQSKMTTLPLLPKLIFEFPVLTNLTVSFGIEGLLEHVALETFYEEYSPLVFATETFPPVNRYFQNFVTVAMTYQKYLTWTVSFVSDLYLSDIERIALDEALLAVRSIMPASSGNVVYTLGLESELQFWISPYFMLKHGLVYTSSEIKDLYPTLTSRANLTLSENVLKSRLSVTHFYTFEDFFSVVTTNPSATETAPERIDRSRHELNLRYEIQVFRKANQQVSLFLEVTSLLNRKNYKGIPYLDQALRLIQGGVHYIF